MAQNVELHFAAKTDTGLARPHNEDSVVFSAEHGLAILADGMGGYSAGEVASGIATTVLKETLEERLKDHEWIAGTNRSKRLHHMMVDSIERTNAAIYEAAQTVQKYRGMGTTLVTALLHHNKIVVAHVGDSRAYRLRQGQLVQLTRDHSLLQEQIDAGLVSAEWARFAPNRNLVTRAMGVADSVEVEIHDHPTLEGDLYLLCSDGLSDMIPPKVINEVLVSHAQNLEMICDTLIDKANASGGRDNISVILIMVGTNKVESVGWRDRILNWFKQKTSR